MLVRDIVQADLITVTAEASLATILHLSKLRILSDVMRTAEPMGKKPA